jgi:NADH-quinone oxidoreductase subunit N
MSQVSTLLPALAPEACLAALAVIALGMEAFGVFRARQHGIVLAALVFGLSLFLIYNPTLVAPTADSLIAIDGFVHGARVLCLSVAAAVILQAAVQPATFQRRSPEHYVLVLLATIGFSVSVAANDFLLLFVALELSTTGSYIMVAQARRAEATLEAGVKYLVMGALSTAFLALGLAYLVGISGGTSFELVRAAMDKTSLALLGAGLVMGSLLFKVSAFPAHLWAPDVYQGAPLPIASLLSTLSKSVGFIVMMGLLDRVFAPHHAALTRGLLCIAAITVLWGNIGALKQTDVTRLLGYSGIAHTGYLLLATSAGGVKASTAVMFYLVQYSFTNLAAFFALGSVAESGAPTTHVGLVGLRQRSPVTAWVLTIALLSAAGIPPLSGCLGKFLLISSLPDMSVHGVEYAIALTCALFGVVLSIVYYFRTVRQIWTPAPASAKSFEPTTGEVVGMFACGAVILVLGVAPQIFWTDANQPWSQVFTLAATGVAAFGVLVWVVLQSGTATAVAPAAAPE